MSNTEDETQNLATALRYLEALASSATGAATITAILHPEIVQTELPNRLVPQGRRRNLEALLQDFERGKKLIASQRYDIRNTLANGDTVAIQAIWSGTLAVAVGPLAVGSTMQAHSAIFLTFREGQIIAQQNYDCFEPF